MSIERTLLLVDDHHVFYRSGTKRTLQPLRRHPENPMLPKDKPWEVTVAYCSVCRHAASGHYQLWYQAYKPGATTVCYAESPDGVHWDKPELGLFDYEGTWNTNIVFRGLKNGGWVVFDPRDPNPDRRYKMACHYGSPDPGLGAAFSPDGIHWTAHPGGIFVRSTGGRPRQPDFRDEFDAAGGARGGHYSLSDVADVSYDSHRGVFVIYGKTWIDSPTGEMFWKRAVCRLESADFVHWSRPQLVMAPDEEDSGDGTFDAQVGTIGGGCQGKQLHSGPGFFYNDMYFSLLQVLDPGETGNMPTELALSHDGLTWSRPFRREPFIPATRRSEFDGSLIWSGATPVFLEDEFRFYYGAYSRFWNVADDVQYSGIGLATMPRDRFAGVRPIREQGQITLKPIDLTGCRALSVNADAARGEIRVEVLDAEGLRIRGYTKEDALPIRGDGLRHPVQWEAKRLAELPAGCYSLRLQLQNAEVFAVTVTA